jgi:MFS family permease
MATETGVAQASKTSRLEFMLRALRYRNYRLFFGGQIVSLVGSWMTQIAMAWLVYRLTQSPLMLGIVGFAGQIPAFLLGPIAGVLVDRWPCHRLLVVTQVLAMVQSFVLALLTLSGHIEVWHVMVLIAFQGLVNAFDMPARQAFVVEMVENKDDLSNAIALNSSMVHMARLIGPAVGGVLIAAVGEGWCFMLDAVSYIGVIAALLAMHVNASPIQPSGARPFQQLKEGWRYASGSPAIRTLLLLMVGMSLVGMPYGVLMPVIAVKVLHGGAHTLGWLMAASGLGALTGALVLAARENIRGLAKAMPYCTGTFGVGLIVFGLSRWEVLSVILLFGMGYAMIRQNASCNMILQTIVDDDKRGRVMSFYTMPFGSLMVGAAADRFGVAATLAVCGVGCVMVAIWYHLRYPALREVVLPIYASLGIVPEIATGMRGAAELTRPPLEQ